VQTGIALSCLETHGSFYVECVRVYFCRVYKGGDVIGADSSLDYAANFAHMLGFKDELMHELMRLYLSIHRFFTSPVLKISCYSLLFKAHQVVPIT